MNPFALWFIVQSLQKLQRELKLRNEELHIAEGNTKRLTNEKVILEQRITALERKKDEEVILKIEIIFVPVVDY